jgi:2-methylcitrate dehydratase PrpD
VRELAALAEFAAGLTLDRLPDPVVERATLVLRDTVGVGLGGMREPEVRALADHAVRTAPGPVGLVGHGGGTTAGWAALVHGTAGTTLEMDEGHAFARGHAAVHAVWPALAAGAAGRATGREALAALVAGYEVAARAGVATRLRRAVHPFGAWGVLGAAAAAARLAGEDADGLRRALEVAASYAITPSFATATLGANVRNTYAGVVNRLGLLAADLARLGFRGEPDGPRTTFGEILGEAFDPAALVDGLGARFEILRGYFKAHSACRYTHAAVDAVLALGALAGPRLGSLEAVDVATYDLAARLAEPAPATPLAARFSVPWVVAAALVRGTAGPAAFTAEALADPAIRRVAARVRVREDPALTALTPARRPARVTLTFAGGARLERTVTGSKGDPDQPLTETELVAKFHALADPTLGAARAAALRERLERVAGLEDVGTLAAWWAPAGPA